MAAAATSLDRFGLSWRGPLAAGILANRARVDCLEVIADDYTCAGEAAVRSLVALARHMPVTLHSIQLGLASTEGLDPVRVDALRRLVDRVEPATWSEHLAFVRSGTEELGHLAAQARNASTVAAVLENLDRVGRWLGRPPAIENIATLVDPPGSTMPEAEWLGRILAGCPNGLLLDLHNVYANALNFGFDAYAFLDQMPLYRVCTLHIAGGRMLERRYLDDHKHPVPPGVFELLTYVAARAPQPLTVILERDGAFPAIGALLAELDEARAAVAQGRAQPAAPCPLPDWAPVATEAEPNWQHKLAIAYCTGSRDGFSGDVDAEGLALAAASFARKRKSSPA